MCEIQLALFHFCLVCRAPEDMVRSPTLTLDYLMLECHQAFVVETNSLWRLHRSINCGGGGHSGLKQGSSAKKEAETRERQKTIPVCGMKQIACTPIARTRDNVMDWSIESNLSRATLSSCCSRSCLPLSLFLQLQEKLKAYTSPGLLTCRTQSLPLHLLAPCWPALKTDAISFVL